MFANLSRTVIGFLQLQPLDIVLIMLVLLLLFGKRLPEVARSLGQSLNMFKKGLNETKKELDDVTKQQDSGSSGEGQ